MAAQQARRPRNPIDGWLVLDKPYGLTSNDALGQLKRLFHPQKIGHAGTLDPRATGCLPIAFGEATKTVSMIMGGRKIYRFQVTWGTETTTDDTEGEVVATSDQRPSADDITAVLSEFTGTIQQVPPAFSAIKVDGERAYDLARSGEEVQLEARPIDIHRLDMVEHVEGEHSVFEAECGKGTYVRALARDLGRRLGCYGHVTSLRRLLVGPFGEADMVSLDEMRQAAENGEAIEDMMRFLLPVRSSLEELPEIPVALDVAGRIRQGVAVLLRGKEAPVNCELAFASHGGVPVAIGSVAAGRFQPSRVLNL